MPADCGCAPGTGGTGGPIILGPGGTMPSGVYPGGTLPMPMPGAAPGRIPPAGIKESPGKQFELEGASKTGPILSTPVGDSKLRGGM